MKPNYIIISIIQFLFYLLIGSLIIKDFNTSNIFLFAIFLIIQLKYKCSLSRNLTFFMFLLWVVFYYKPVFDSGMYYTSEQVFTDSNYYDYYSLYLSDFDFGYIIKNSNQTWQSNFVISFYAFVYKVFGKFLLNPIIVNLILIYFTFILIRIHQIEFKYLKFFILLIPFMALNVVVPGKEPITLFFMALIMNSYFSKEQFSKKNNIKRLFWYIGSAVNRFNSIPIILIFEIQRFKKSKISALVFSFLAFLVVYFFLGDKLSFYLDIESFIGKQRGGSDYPEMLLNILLPNNIILFILTTPIRLIAFLASPFPNFNVLTSYSNSNNIFFYYFTIFKFFSGLGWTYFIYKIYKNRCLFSSSLILILLLIVVLISSVHLVEGGRYRILCDITLFWFFAMGNSENNNYLNKINERK